MQNAGLDEEQAGLKTARRNINNLRYADDTTLKAENEEELESLLMKVKEESEKAGLKLNILGEGNGNSLQYRCLENLMDGGAWWTAVHEVAKSRARLSDWHLHLNLKARNNIKLKLNIQKIKIMASGPITSWQIDGETMETVTDFIFLSPKSLQMMTAAMKLKDTCSLEEKLWQT